MKIKLNLDILISNYLRQTTEVCLFDSFSFYLESVILNVDRL